MAEIFKFFNSAPGDERWHYASDFADYFGGVLSDGILHTDKQTDLGLRVSVVTGTLTTKVSVGKAIIKGYAYENTTDLTLKHDIPEPTLKRIDRIVLRLDLSNSSRYVKLFVKKGASATSPIAPTLQRDQYIHELSLAQVLVRENTTQLIETDLKDERMIESLCGLVSSIISVPTTQFQEQWDTWFESVKNEGFAPYSDTGFKQNLKTTNKTTIVDGVNELKEDYVRSPGYAVASGTNAYSITLNPAPTTYKDGMGLIIKIVNSSTATASINVNGLGAKSILKANGTAMTDFKAGVVYSLRYNGTNFYLQGEGGNEKEVISNTVNLILGNYMTTYVDEQYLYTVDKLNNKAYKILKANGTIVKTINSLYSFIIFYADGFIAESGSKDGAPNNDMRIYNESGSLITSYRWSTRFLGVANNYLYFYDNDYRDSVKNLRRYSMNQTLLGDVISISAYGSYDHLCIKNDNSAFLLFYNSDLALKYKKINTLLSSNTSAEVTKYYAKQNLIANVFAWSL